MPFDNNTKLRELIKKEMTQRGLLKEKNEKGVWSEKAKLAWMHFCNSTSGYSFYTLKIPSFETLPVEKAEAFFRKPKEENIINEKPDTDLNKPKNEIPQNEDSNKPKEGVKSTEKVKSNIVSKFFK